MMCKKAVVFVFLLVMTCGMAVGCRAMEETLNREDNTVEQNTSIKMPQNEEQGEDNLGDKPTTEDLTTEEDMLQNK